MRLKQRNKIMTNMTKKRHNKESDGSMTRGNCENRKGTMIPNDIET